MSQSAVDLFNNPSLPTHTIQSQDLKRGDYAVLCQVEPFDLKVSKICRIFDVSWSKMGKVGWPKCHYVGLDLVTGRKIEVLVRALDRGAHPVHVPKTVTKTEYLMIGYSDANDQYLKLLPLAESEDSEINEGVMVPNSSLGAQLKADFEAGKELVVMVHTVLDSQGVVSFREEEPQQENERQKEDGVQNE
jgi:translation initiation factor 5A